MALYEIKWWKIKGGKSRTPKPQGASLWPPTSGETPFQSSAIATALGRRQPIGVKRDHPYVTPNDLHNWAQPVFRIGTWDAMLATNWSLTFPHSFLKFVGISARSSSWNIGFLQVFIQTLSSGTLFPHFSEKMKSWIQAVYYQLWKISHPGLFNLSICIPPAPQIRNSWGLRPGWEHNRDLVFVNLMVSTWLDFVAPRTQTSMCL